MNTKTRETYLDNQLIEGLTPKEFDLLYTLAKTTPSLFTRTTTRIGLGLSILWR